TRRVWALVNGRPNLSHVVEQFTSQGFRKFVLATGYLSERVEDFARSELRSCSVSISNAGPDASMLRRIQEAKSYLDPEVVVAYGDTFIDLGFRSLLDVPVPRPRH